MLATILRFLVALQLWVDAAAVKDGRLDSSHASNDSCTTSLMSSRGNCTAMSFQNTFDTMYKILEDGFLEIGMKVIPLSQYPTYVKISPDNFCVNGTTETLIYCDQADFHNIVLNRKVNAGLDFAKAVVLTVGCFMYALLGKDLNVSGWAQFSCFLGITLHLHISIVHTLVYLDTRHVQPTIWCFVIELLFEYTHRANDTTWFVANFDLARLTWQSNYHKGRKICTPRFIIYMFIGWAIPLFSVVADFCRRHLLKNVHEDRMNSLGFHKFSWDRCLPVMDMLFFSPRMVFLGLSFGLYFISLYMVLQNRCNNQATSKSLKTNVHLHVRLFAFMGLLFLPTKITPIFLKLSVDTMWIWMLIRVYDVIICAICTKGIILKAEKCEQVKGKYKWLNNLCMGRNTPPSKWKFRSKISSIFYISKDLPLTMTPSIAPPISDEVSVFPDRYSSQRGMW